MAYTDINSEDRLVQATFATHLEQNLGWDSVYAWNQETFGPTGTLGCTSERDVVLVRDLRAALIRLNPQLPPPAVEDAITQLTHHDYSRSLIQHNQAFFKLIRDGVPVSYRDAQGQLRHGQAAVIDFRNPANNRFLAVRELKITGLRTPMVAEQGELVARVSLSEILETVLDAIAKFVLASQLQSCCDSITTTGISRKSTDLSRTMARQEVVDALNAELSALNVHELHATMKPESPGGKTQFKLTLELPGGGQPAAILSEGEQRAIAIASFLTEVNLAKRLGGVIFDDPVSSLDHKRRWSVASRLAKESLRRQVIVFTHDIYFLCILQQEAETLGIEPLTQCIQKGEAGFGVQSNFLPFDALVTSKRVKALRNLHNEVARVHISGDQTLATKLTREAYSHLRMAWERAVEEVLFAGVVTRFGEGVSTHMLRFVTVEDSDYKEIDVGMTRCSKFSGHDPAAAAQLPTPHPDILKADIEKLETWRLSVVNRKDAVKDRRT